MSDENFDRARNVRPVFPWLYRASWPAFGFALAGLVVVRSGVRTYPSIDELVAYARDFPRPPSSYKASAAIDRRWRIWLVSSPRPLAGGGSMGC